MKKLALKKLKGSDLSFFKSYFVKHPQAKQKGFNLDAKVLEGEFYPGLKTRLAPLPKKAVHVDLTLAGPGGAESWELARKIKIDAKNLRLNGELIDDPIDHPGRFDKLKEDDFALFEFDGLDLPRVVNVLLVGLDYHEDAALHSAFADILPKKTDSMCLMSDEVLIGAIKKAKLLEDHPVYGWLKSEMLERAAVGDEEAISFFNKKPVSRGMSVDILKAAKASAEKTGELGEELLDLFLCSQVGEEINSYEWTSQRNAISPYDFEITEHGEVRYVDAKSTVGDFTTPLHMSVAEIKFALQADAPYDLYRLFKVSDGKAEMRVARDVKQALLPFVGLISGLPDGVRVDSFSIDPEFFEFSQDIICIDSNE